jgi:hypothetical protein
MGIFGFFEKHPAPVKQDELEGRIVSAQARVNELTEIITEAPRDFKNQLDETALKQAQATLVGLQAQRQPLTPVRAEVPQAKPILQPVPGVANMESYRPTLGQPQTEAQNPAPATAEPSTVPVGELKPQTI